MNRFWHISLALVLLLAVSGVTVASHYCHGHVQAVSVATNGEHPSCSGMDDSSCGGCEDRIASTVVDIDVLLTASAAVPAPSLLISLHLPSASPVDDGHVHLFLAASDTGPPATAAAQDLPLLHQQFLK